MMSSLPKCNLDSDKLPNLSTISPKILSMTLLQIHLKAEKKEVKDKKRQRGFEMRVGLQQRWEVVTGLCGDSRPVKPTNVVVMPLAGCSKTVIMKNTGGRQYQMAPLHPTVEISRHKSRVAEAEEAEAGFSAAD